MLTVREAVRMIGMTDMPNATIEIGYDGGATTVQAENTLFMDAYGDYIVDNIDFSPCGVVLMLCVRAVKAPPRPQQAHTA